MQHFDFTEICDGRSPHPESEGGFFPLEGKDAFEIAYANTEKIINCSAFRRMQGKTQVYPFPTTDAVRNRLTHSIEVAHIGQTIATKVFAPINCEETIKRAAQQIVNNGCLLHDIGNPPFGHGGEEAIREFFRAADSIKIVKDAFCNVDLKNDFLLFDGNAQGFRIATTLNGRKYDGGLRLGAATLCAMVKYPYGSSEEGGKPGKFGFMNSESEYFRTVFGTCGLTDGKGVLHRSPLSLIVEAADDIAYLTADLQDAYIYGDIDFKFALGELALLAQSDRPFAEAKDRGDTISEFRSLAVNKMITLASERLYNEVFKNKSVVDRFKPFSFWSTEAAQGVEASEDRIRAKSNESIYRGRRKVTLQVAGGRIIKFVLEMQIRALNDLYIYLLGNRTTVDLMPAHIENQLDGPPTLEKLAKHLLDNLERGIRSRESVQVILRMPTETQGQMMRLFVEACQAPQFVASSKIPCEAGAQPADEQTATDEQLAYGLIQLAVDFVSGTTDRYLSNYSKDWAGPSLT
ncbi:MULTISPECIES: deoxyguanosinetriphosphate triphosphohydrolase family protein [Bradyrhizobium]|uniref:deoxyguanosinetriphosphate triphosphohydrolase family protein n=1 Tax=Bradyrhizobium TaxID=374 RepID=UPI000C1F3F90|nr:MULTISPECIES: dNTP triphosphohydrolase [Bradyrhizobium]